MSKTMRMDLSIELENDRVVTARIGLPEFVAFEREYDVPSSVFSDRDSGTRLEWLFYLAHRALKRQGTSGVPSSFEDFLAIVVDLDVENDDEGDDAGAPGQLPGDDEA